MKNLLLRDVNRSVSGYPEIKKPFDCPFNDLIATNV